MVDLTLSVGRKVGGLIVKKLIVNEYIFRKVILYSQTTLIHVRCHCS